MALVVSALGDELLGAADFDDGVPGWFFSRRWGGLETDLVDGRRRGGDGDPGDFLLNCSMSEHHGEEKEVSIFARDAAIGFVRNENHFSLSLSFWIKPPLLSPFRFSGSFVPSLFGGENFVATQKPRVKEPKRPARARRSQRIMFDGTVLIQNHRARSPRSIPRHSQTAISERENVTQKREREPTEREREKRKEKSYIFRKRDAFGAIRIARVPLLFVDAVGTLVPTNAEDRNANAMLFDACVCVCV